MLFTGKPSKIRCVDQKFLSGERLPEHQPVALGFSDPSIHNLEVGYLFT